MNILENINTVAPVEKGISKVVEFNRQLVVNPDVFRHIRICLEGEPLEQGELVLVNELTQYQAEELKRKYFEFYDTRKKIFFAACKTFILDAFPVLLETFGEEEKTSEVVYNATLFSNWNGLNLFHTDSAGNNFLNGTPVKEMPEPTDRWNSANVSLTPYRIEFINSFIDKFNHNGFERIKAYVSKELHPIAAEFKTENNRMLFAQDNADKFKSIIDRINNGEGVNYYED